MPLASGTNFSDPTDIAVGPSGHVYISTEGPGDDNVHEFVDGVLVASWGGSGAEALDQPLGLAVDADENLYVADVNWMRKFSRPACS